MKDIPGYEGLYAATEDGRIWSHPKPLSGAFENKGYRKGKWLKCCTSRGYKVVGFGKTDTHLVHRLIALTFLGMPIGNQNHINHKNGIKSDNRVENLEWCTQGENNTHAWKTGLMTPARKISMKDTGTIRFLAKGGMKQKELATIYNVGRATIQRVIHCTHGY